MSQQSSEKPAAVRSGLWLGLYAAGVLCVLLSYFKSYPLPDFAAKLAALFSISFLLLGCFSVGKLLTGVLVEDRETPGEASNSSVLAALLSLFLGIGCVGLAVLILGWYVPGSLKLKLTLLSLILGGLSLRVLWLRQIPVWDLSSVRFTMIETAAICLGVAGALVSFITCFSPITYYDSLVYHLALPNLYNQLDKITAVPFNLYSCFPANFEMLFLYLLNQLPQGEYAVNLLGWSVTCAISAGITQWAYELGGRRTAVWSFLLWWCMPAVLLLSVGAYVDVALGGFIFFAIRSFYVALTARNPEKWLLVSGLLAGFAFSIKYTGAICGILLLVFLLAGVLRGRFPFRALLLFAAAVALPGIFWLIKNFQQVGNPVFPFFYKWLGGNVGWTESSADAYFMILTEYKAKSNVFLELIKAPLSLTTSAQSYGGGFDVLGDFGWPLFLFGAPVAFFLNRRHTAFRLLGLYMACHFLIWFFTKPVLRFLIGLLPVMAVLAAAAYHQLTMNKRNWHKAAVMLFVVPWLLSNFFLYFFISDGFRPFSVVMGLQTREEFLSQRLTFYPLFRILNNEMTPDDKVLLLGEQRTYHLNKPFLSSNYLSSSPVSLACNQANSVEEVGAFFKSNGLNLLLVNEGEVARAGGMGHFGFNENGTQIIQKFIQMNAQLVIENQGVKLYRLTI